MKRVVSIPPNYFFLGIVLIVIPYFFIPQMNLISYPFNLIGIFLIILGMWLVSKSWLLFKKYNTPETFSPSTALVKENIYSFSRNPMYLGAVISLLGLVILLGNVLAFISPIIFLLIMDRMFIPYEEEKMAKIFKDEYLKYKNKVRRWL